jgi:WD40 repeat protein
MAVSAEESNFVTASLEQRATDQWSARRRRRNLVSVLLVALLVASGLATLAFAQSRRAQEEASQAAVWNLVGASGDALGRDPELALLLALAAAEKSDRMQQTAPPEVISALLKASNASRLELMLEAPLGPIDASASMLATVAPDPGQPSLLSHVTLRALDGGRPLRTLPGQGQVGALAFSPDGQWLAVGYRPGQLGDPSPIVIWATSTGEELGRLAGPTHLVQLSIVWSPDGGFVGAGSRSGFAVWASQGEWRRQFLIESRDVGAVEFLDADQLLVTDPSEQLVGIHDARTGNLTRQFEVPSLAPTHVAVDRVGSRVVLASASTGTISVWDLDSLGEIWASTERNPRLDDLLALDVEAGMVAVSDTAGQIQVLDLETGRETMTLSRPSESVVELEWVPGGRQLVSTASAGIRIWTLGRGGPSWLSTDLAVVDSICGVTFSPDGSRALAWSTAGEIIVVDMESGALLSAWTDQQVDYFAPPAVSEDWHYAAWMDEAGKAWTFDLETGERLTPLGGCGRPVAFSPDGRLVVLDRCLFDGSSSRVVDMATGQVVLDLGPRPILGRGGAFFNPGGEWAAGRLLAVNLDGVVEIYDVEMRTLLATFVTDTFVMSMDFEPTGGLLALGLGSGRTQVVDMAQVVDGTPTDDALIFDQATNPYEVAGIALSEDLVATSSFDALRIWNIESGELVAEPATEIDTPPFSTFSVDGRFLFYIDDPFVLRRLPLSSEDVIDYARSRLTRSLTAAECIRYFGPGGCDPGS